MPLARDMPETCDLYIGNRGHRVIGLVRRARRRLFWLHNPARYLRKPRNVWRLAWYRPTLVVTGAYHAKTIPPWLLHGGCETIPYGVLDRFRAAGPREPPPPRAIFTSNPLRGLDWLLDLWTTASSTRGSKGRVAHILRTRGVRGARGAAGGRDGGGARPRRCARGLRRAPPRAGRARGACGGTYGRAGHALPRRSGRDVLPGAGRGAGDGRARNRDPARRGRRAGPGRGQRAGGAERR